MFSPTARVIETVSIHDSEHTLYPRVQSLLLVFRVFKYSLADCVTFNSRMTFENHTLCSTMKTTVFKTTLELSVICQSYSLHFWWQTYSLLSYRSPQSLSDLLIGKMASKMSRLVKITDVQMNHPFVACYFPSQFKILKPTSGSRLHV